LNKEIFLCYNAGAVQAGMPMTVKEMGLAVATRRVFLGSPDDLFKIVRQADRGRNVGPNVPYWAKQHGEEGKQNHG
jgi:hypothetical protein